MSHARALLERPYLVPFFCKKEQFALLLCLLFFAKELDGITRGDFTCDGFFTPASLSSEESTPQKSSLYESKIDDGVKLFDRDNVGQDFTCKI